MVDSRKSRVNFVLSLFVGLKQIIEESVSFCK